jgi:hypothetical protein
MLNFNYIFAPKAEYTGPTNIEFLAGVPGRFRLTTRGARTRINWDNPKQHLANVRWLQLIESSDGTLTLAGTPPIDSPRSTMVLDACPTAEFSSISLCLVGNLKLHVIPTPRFTNPPVGFISEVQSRGLLLGVNRWSGTVALCGHVHRLRGARGRWIYQSRHHWTTTAWARRSLCLHSELDRWIRNCNSALYAGCS